jgi:outer membrane protein OmpA-like peptidoglycan-associated protein/flagellar hook assembly protein FlgD
VKKILLLILLATACLANMVALPGSAGELGYNLTSPLFLSQGFNIFNNETPQAVGVNPAAAAGFQRIIFDANYINLEQFENETGDYGGMGHSLNLGLSIPMKVGVITTTAHYVDTTSFDNSSLNFSNYTGLDLAFSKELYEDVHFGFGLNGTLGFSGEMGLSTSLGLLFMYGDMGSFSDVTFGLVLSRLGMGYAPNGRGFFASVQENFTPAAGVSATLIDNPGFSVDGQFTLSFPAFTDIKMDTGANINIGERLNLFTSLSMSAQDLINGDWQTIIPSLGFNFVLPLTPREENSRLNSTEMKINGAGRVLYDGIYAFGGGVTMPFGVRDKEPPKVDITYNKDDSLQSWISPNYDGIQDELTVPFTVSDERYIQGYKIIVKDKKGQTVKEIYNKDERPENATFSNFFDRLFAEKESVAIPEKFRWDGVADSGDIPPDGEFSFTFEFWDDNNNKTVTAPSYFTIDNTQPELTLESPSGTDLIFSPDGDGNKDLFKVPQSGSSEKDWKGEIKDNTGSVYKTFEWTDGKPEEMVWDGTNDEGEVLPDGVYEYAISTTDNAGNSVKQSVANILINTAQPELALTIDRAYFSPETDSEFNSLEIGFQISTIKGLADWKLDIVDESGRVFRTWNRSNSGDLLSGKGQTFDGVDSSGKVLPEGTYKARLDASYQNGFSPVVFTPPFEIDRTSPVVSVTGSPLLFSPDGDGNRDEIKFTQSSSKEDTWSGYILDEGGRVVKTYQWHGEVPSSLTWNGLFESGESVKGEASFSYYVETRDRAGNYGRSEEISFTADTSNVELFLTLDRESISPNGDGINESMLIGVERNIDSSPVKTYKLSVVDNMGRVVSVIEEGTTLPKSIKWNGGQVADGSYQLALSVDMERGDQVNAASPEFLIDRIYPEITIKNDINLFSPDGDGFKDSVLISQESSKEDLFEGEILNSRGDVLSSWVWQGSLENLSWGGQDHLGNILPNGDYAYRVVSTDKAGNRTERTIEGLTVDSRVTPLFLTAEKDIFSPSGAERFKTQTFDLITSLKEGIESWTLEIIHNEEGVVKALSGNNLPPEEFIWDGKSDSGSIVEGNYLARYTLVYKKGNRPVAETAPFILDNSAPEARVVLSPLPFSPDEDNVDDELTISMGVQDISAVESWEMEIIDPKGNDFITYGGKGKPTGRIIWDGRSSKGELVQSAEDYTWRLTVSDVMGNSSIEEGLIPVDVLVIRDGDNLKIMISSITFEPGEAALKTTGDAVTKNDKILARIAQILNKYNRYQIQVEGHANSVYYYDKARYQKEEKEELQPLSENRAKTVVNALIGYGIDKNRLTSVGKGGTKPVVPFSDTENNWKNRRVEFILVK